MSITPEGEIVEARFVERPNRFIVVAEAEGAQIDAHCPNPGRLTEMLHPGNRFLLRKRPGATPDQATTHSVVAAIDPRFHVDSDLDLGQAPEDPSFEDGAWVLLDTQMANRLVVDALDQGGLEELAEPTATYRKEPRVEHGRFDVALDTEDGERMVEVKSVTLLGEDGRTGLFPDAPTERGVRHLQALTERARKGKLATLLFVAYRTDVVQIAPNAETDPDFARALREAREAGVQVVARSLLVDEDNWRFALGRPIPVVDVDLVSVGGSLDED